MKTTTRLVCLIAFVYLAFGSLDSEAQQVKVVVGSPVARLPQAPSVSNAGLTLSCGNTGRVGEDFVVATAKGGKAPYSFTVTPTAGVTFNNATGQQNGSLVVKTSTYTAGENAKFDVTVKDSNSTTVQNSCSIDIVPATPGALALVCPGPAYVNTAFLIANVSGGTPPYTYKTDTTLPPPLVLNPTTGVVTGASTAGTIDAITIEVTDSSSNGVPFKKDCSITVKEHSYPAIACSLFPVNGRECVGYGVARNANINTFWGTYSGFVFFNQVKSIYNGASNSETVSADIGTLNFPVGLQVNLGTNIQTGSVQPTAVSTGTTPTLSPSAAAQAAQTMLYGGTIYLSGAYPLLAVGGNRISSPGSWGGMMDLALREGVDTQSFKAGTSTGLTNPSSHTSVQLEGYAQMNSTNLTLAGDTFAGALFIGGSYGYSYTSHQFIRDYGIAKPSNSLAQVSAGIVLNGVAKLAFSKAFGPSQTYFDGTVTPPPTKPSPTTTNNFKTWSFELSYQAPAPGSK
jgi:hypothetical protein